MCQISSIPGEDHPHNEFPLSSIYLFILISVYTFATSLLGLGAYGCMNTIGTTYLGCQGSEPSHVHTSVYDIRVGGVANTNGISIACDRLSHISGSV